MQSTKFRDVRCKQEFLKLIQSSDFNTIYKQIESISKQTEQQKKQIKERVTHEKDEKRKIRKNTEKVLAEIFQIQQDIEQKRVHLSRISSERDALTNKQQKSIIEHHQSHTDTKYHISQLLTEDSCKEIFQKQQETLESLKRDIDGDKVAVETEKESNIALTKQSEELKLKERTHRDALTLRQQQQSQRNGTCSLELVALRQELQSMKKLLMIKEMSMERDEVRLQFESASNEEYLIQIRLDSVDEKECSIRSVDVTHRDTRYPIGSWVLSRYQESGRTVADIPRVSLKQIVRDLIVILKRLPMRYDGMNKLKKVYGEEMVPWLPENDELVFRFTMKQAMRRNEMEQDQDPEDEKSVDEVVVSIPVVISVGWNYPQKVQDGTGNEEVIKVEHYNCNLEERERIEGGERIEMRWNEVLKQTVDEVKGKFQNDIVGFVQFIHGKLQQFARDD